MGETFFSSEIFNSIYLALLKVIDVFEYAFNVFGGINRVTLDKDGKISHDFLLNILFTNSGVSKIFWGITLIGFFVSIIFSLTALIRSNLDTENKKTFGKAIGLIGKTAVTFLIIPVLVITIVKFTDVVINKIDEIILVRDSSLSNTVLSLTDMFIFSAGEETTNTSSLVGTIVSLFLVCIMAATSIKLLVKIFEMLLLYLISPLFVISMPVDGGARFREWRDLFFSKLIIVLTIIIGMKLYLFVIPIVISDGVILSDVLYVDLALKLIFICGGMFAIYKSGNLISKIIIKEKEGEEGESESKTESPEHEVKLLKAGESEMPLSNKSNLFSGSVNLYKEVRK